MDINDNVPLLNGGYVTVLEKLGEGGQGAVYRVNYNGSDYALKWYHPNAVNDRDAFYKNLQHNAEIGAPSNMFIWPLYITEVVDDSFGYVMALRPNKFYEFSDFLLARVHFSSVLAQLDAALNIISAFSSLHRHGFSYQDLNDTNFFINPENGDVLICDNDNVAPYGCNLGVKGKPRYMAPEIVRNINRPDIFSDRFSLAVILFELFFNAHPLEGKRVIECPCLTEELDLEFYGKHPIFMYDKNSDLNRPDPIEHKNVIKYWKLYPSSLRDCFYTSFSYNAMNSDDMNTARQTRLVDSAWQSCITNLKSSLVQCECGNEFFINTDSTTICDKCGKVIPKPFVLSTLDGKYKIPLFPGVKIYQTEISAKDETRYREVVGEVTRHPSDNKKWGLRNLSLTPWRITTPIDEVCILLPGKSISLLKIKSVGFDISSTGVLTR